MNVSPRQNRRLLPAWLLGCTVGELVGFGATAAIAAGAVVLFGRPESTLGRAVALALMTCVGMLEGASLGYFQWRVLRRAVPAVPRRAWVGATVAVAAGGWFLGMLPPLIVHLVRGAEAATANGAQAAGPELSTLAYLGFAAAFGAVAGVLFGLAQWVVLRRYVPRGAAWWIPANAVGWALGLPWAYLAGRLGDPAASPVTAIAIALGGAVAMGLSMALATGVCLARITARPAGG